MGKKGGEEIGQSVGYKQEYCEKIVAYFDMPPQQMVWEREYYNDGTLKKEKPIVLGGDFPTIQGFAVEIGVDVNCLELWRQEQEAFATAYAHAMALQEKIWLVNSMSGQYSAPFAKFFGINCLGYKEKKEQKTETQLGVPDLSHLSTQELKQLIEDNL